MLEAPQAGVKSFLPKTYMADRLLNAVAEILSAGADLSGIPREQSALQEQKA